ncbi:MAG: hypothetical protein CMH46_16700 [Muricauda sp.]|nr:MULTISPECIES: GLPGLI family protein [unclassified Allomuricauda]MAU17169.1 hypothetical protein [Allomuricauda sp.]|tara:strand:+ start:8175 stop:8909 length:735 start_codon:yes stop_codon:yes gene_type:complete
MKKTLIVTVLSFISYFGFGQGNSGEVHYKVSAVASYDDYEASKGPIYNELKQGILSNIVNLDFLLQFNQTKSEFGLVKNLPLDMEDFHAKITVDLSRGKSKFYTDFTKRALLEQKEFLGEQFIIETPIEEFNWTLTNEQKKLKDFICYKAIGERTYQTKELEIKKAEMIAWYCPEIPYAFGPFEAVGLPGLVMEFQVGNFIFSANELKLDKRNVEITPPKKGKLISLEEYNNILGKTAVGETRY